jgi:hypothetical protein
MKYVFLTIALLCIPSLLSAEGKKLSRSSLFQKVIDCRSIADNNERLACYDAQVTALDQAETSRQVVIVDQVEVQKARRGLFGFDLPDLGKLFDGSDSDGKSQIEEVTSVVSSASQQKSGKWVIRLEDGAVWAQIDNRSLFTPRPGHTVRIRRAALGSYLANINGQTAIRVSRTN